MTDRVLSTVSLLCSSMAARWPRWVTDMTSVVEGHDSTIGGTRGSGPADPTASTATTRVDITRHAEDLRAILLFVARELDAELSRIPAHLKDPKATDRARCSGEYDPTCTDNAVAKGLCYRCYRRKARGQPPAQILVDPSIPSTRYVPLTAEEAARRINKGEAIASIDALRLTPEVQQEESA